MSDTKSTTTKSSSEPSATKPADKGGDATKRELLKMIRDKFLLPNICYLKEIGRLPEEFVSVDFEQEFAF